jgi:hypothetical protein
MMIETMIFPAGARPGKWQGGSGARDPQGCGGNYRHAPPPKTRRPDHSGKNEEDYDSSSKFFHETFNHLHFSHSNFCFSSLL